MTLTILHSSLHSFSHYSYDLCIEPSRRIRETGQGPVMYCLVTMRMTLLLAHLNQSSLIPQQALCSLPPHASTCPALTQAIISAQAWIQVQETWSVSHPSPFECVPGPSSLFAEVLLISADLPMIVGRLLFLLLLGQGLALARKTGRTWAGHVCICV